MAKKKNAPNLLIIGVPKAGTTSLYNYLACNDAFFFPSIKEPHFFVSEYVKKRVPVCLDNWDDYLEIFKGGEGCKFIGEASVFYFYYSKYAIRQIKRYLGEETYIILMLRNPVDRAYSAYRYTLALNKDENLTFAQAIEVEKSRVAEGKVSPMMFYVSCGMYAERLEHWKNEFPNLKVVIFDDLVRDPHSVVRDIYGFLDIEFDARIEVSKKYNTGFGSEWKNPLLGKLVKNLSGRSFRNLSNKYFPSGYQFTKNMFLKIAMKNTSMGKDDKQRLRKIFSDDVLKTSRIIDRDLSFWLHQ